ncbi:hypothetical protein Nepgr_005335 [Nepenthes gracilis]|uniref:Uncharacterized protein n=1 Tax=Nepenthes gracilis TaxID=150966 RepID=A0AAD3XGI1_NEPGR|nr:hypothetical protein Nepgr_005335 [Nepenthes gracilis]
MGFAAPFRPPQKATARMAPGIPAIPPPSPTSLSSRATNFRISESIEDIHQATGYINSAYLQDAPRKIERCIEAHHCNPKAVPNNVVASA